jgi:hypothetical protein
VAYKCSELGIQRVQKNEENASKKISPHYWARWQQVPNLKWEKMEQELLARGITPATISWPERSSEKEPRNFTSDLRLKTDFPVRTGCCIAHFIWFIMY